MTLGGLWVMNCPAVFEIMDGLAWCRCPEILPQPFRILRFKKCLRREIFARPGEAETHGTGTCVSEAGGKEAGPGVAGGGVDDGTGGHRSATVWTLNVLQRP